LHWSQHQRAQCITPKNQGSTAQFCVLDHRPVCADGKEKSAVATLCINEHFRFTTGQRCAMVGETARKASAVNCAGLP
jgi:chitodextrinase